MMERLREGVNSIAVKIILGLIILSFIFAGVGNYIVGGGNNAAAKVGKTEISRGEFEQAYQNERNRMQSQLGDYFSTLLADPTYVASLRRSVLDSMINDILIEQHAQSLGLRVSDNQVRQAIIAMPEFQSAGQFDQNIYQSALRRAGFTPDAFAEYMRRSLVRDQLVAALQTSEFTLPGEVEGLSALVAQARDVRTITLPTTDFAKEIQLTDQEIEQYYQQNDDRYTRPEQMRISYIELSAQQLKQAITITDEQTKAFYDAHQDKYASKEQRKVSHIMIQGDDQQAAQAILDQLHNGADFAQLAKEKSQDIGSSQEGGELGWIERDTMDAAFESAAFALQQVGEISGLVKSDFGYHIIKLDELKAPVIKPYEQVAAEIKAELQDQQAVDRFYQLQTELERIAFESPDSLDEAAKAIGADIQRTDFISVAELPATLSAPAVIQALRQPEVKEDQLNSDAIEIAPEHVVVVRVEQTRPEIILPLAEVREQIVATLSRLKAEQQALQLANDLVTALNAGDNSLLDDHQLAFSEVQRMDRSSPLAEIVFSMPKPEGEHHVYAHGKDAQGNVVIIALAAVTTEVDPQLNQQIGAQLSRIGLQQNVEGILGVLRQNTNIQYYGLEQ
ncbi:peptidylprolyl isomerase [Vibrio metschnikovii]|nr:peptidylprolyl isomerase [Vibrio metschnikovii]